MTQLRDHAFLGITQSLRTKSPERVRPSFRISSMMLVMPVIAVCLAVWQADVSYGMFVTVGVLPALVYTCVRAYQSVAAGRPMEVFDKVRIFVIALYCASLIEFAAVMPFS
jgi:hypothetical protein